MDKLIDNAARLFSCALLFCCAAAMATAQPVAATDRVFIGLYGHYVSATHTAEFYQLPGYYVPSGTSSFTDGSGSGGGGGVLFDIPFTAFFRSSPTLSRVRLGIRTGYVQYDGALTAEEPAIVRRRDGSPVSGSVTHTISSSFSYGFFESTVGFVPFGGFQVFMGGQVAVPLSATFVQTQEVGRPLGATFADPDSRVAEQEGDIPGVNQTLISATVGISHAFALDRHRQLLFTPEVLLTIPFTDVANDISWQTSLVRLGVALTYTPVKVAIPQRDTVFLRDTVVRTAVVERERVYFAEVNSRVRTGRNGAIDTLLISESYVREVPAQVPPVPSVGVSVWAAGVPAGDTLVVEERVVLTAVPLLGYVFFDSASAAIPARYVQITEEQAASFSAADLRPASELDIYRQVLNIAGQRLQASNRATVTLTGCNDGAGERGSGIAGRRANTIREYLMRVWRIPASRIRVLSRDLPAMPSNSAVREGAEENRRVEISFSDAELASPLWTADTTTILKTEQVALYPQVEGVFTRWQLTAIAGAARLFSAEGTANSDTLDWHPEASSLASVAGAVDVRLVAYKGAQEYRATAQLPVRRITAAGKRAAGGDREIERYSLLLFPFDGAALSAEQRTLLRSLSARLAPENRLTIIGTTDAIGEEDYNVRLSLQRARAVAEALNRSDAEVIGAGEDTTTYPDDVPEGRFYSRTVRIEVERIVRE